MAAMIRSATQADVEGIAAIHNRAIRESPNLWLWEEIALPARLAWLEAQARADRPVLVAEAEGRVAGFASYGPFRAYAGYRDTIEHSVYVDPAHHGRGLGRALMERLIEEARDRRMHVMVAAIGLPNDPSVALHRALGFTEAGRMPEVGCKFGRYWDLLLMQLML